MSLCNPILWYIYIVSGMSPINLPYVIHGLDAYDMIACALLSYSSVTSSACTAHSLKTTLSVGSIWCGKFFFRKKNWGAIGHSRLRTGVNDTPPLFLSVWNAGAALWENDMKTIRDTHTLRPSNRTGQNAAPPFYVIWLILWFQLKSTILSHSHYDIMAMKPLT